MNVNKCSCTDCDLDTWREYDKCVLHCPKNDYSNDWNDGTLSSFYDEFKKYIIDSVKKSHKYIDDMNAKLTIEELEANNIDKENFDAFEEYQIVPRNIMFPTRDDRDYFDYFHLLDCFGKVWFIGCEFYLSDLELARARVFFQDCIFLNDWYLYDYSILKNRDNVIYQTCKFNKLISAYSREDDIYILSYSQFDYTCIFYQGLELDFVHFKEPLFNTNQENYQENYAIKYIKFEYCIFEKKLELINCKIDTLYMNKNTFEDKFECKFNLIQKFTIDDSNFTELVDFYKTEFIEFKIYKSIFEKFVGFEECRFGKSKGDNKYIAIFEYATFLDFTNFRNTKFLSGLNMEKINLKEYPNFLGSFVEFQNTNRETFRILKYSYDKIGNHIQANKYFSLEMKKHKVELKDKLIKGYLQEKFIFWINEKMSNFGQSFIRPIGLIVFFSIMYGLIIYGNEHTWLMDISPKVSEILNTIVQGLNYPLKEFRPLEKILKKDYEFMSLIFNIIFSVLTWQTIVAVKRYTKR